MIDGINYVIRFYSNEYIDLCLNNNSINRFNYLKYIGIQIYISLNCKFHIYYKFVSIYIYIYNYIQLLVNLSCVNYQWRFNINIMLVNL